MYVNDILLKYCKFYKGHAVEHRIESIQIFIKATWFITSCQSQSETENKKWTSTIPNFLNYLAQSCVGSRQRNYVKLDPSFAPTFTSWLLPYLTLT